MYCINQSIAIFVLSITKTVAMKTVIEMKNEAVALNLSKSVIEIDSQIIFNRPNCLMVCRVVEIREKAVRVDYANEPICGKSGITVYNYSCWIPKSAIIHDEYGSLVTKKWFENTFKGGWRIKPYYLNKGVIVKV